VLDPTPIAIADGAGGPSVASDGAGFLVTWTGIGGLWGTPVGADGTLPDPAGALITDDAYPYGSGSVAWSGTRYLVAWTRREPGFPAGLDVYAARVRRDGSVEDPAGIPVATGVGDQQVPVVAGGRPFLVAWRDWRWGSEDVWAARIDDDGTVLDVPSLAIATSALDETEVSLARAAGTTWGVVSTRFMAESPYGARRAFLRTVTAPK
jgi:hypothetical protein